MDYDVIIIGGGIQGATMALAAARRGLRLIVLERDEIAAGATVNSFGIVHGGFRYLQSLSVARWLRSREEQSWFLFNFPELVRPLSFIMPLYRGRFRCASLFRVAFALDRALSSVLKQNSPLPQGRLLSAKVVTEYPVPKKGLVGGALWNDATLEDPRTAVRGILNCAGGQDHILRTCVDVRGPISDSNGIRGVCAVDRNSGQQIRFHAPVVILCAGSWSRALAARFDCDEPKLSAATLAFNILLDVTVPFRAGLVVSPEPGRGRSYFLRPFDGGLLAGTYYVAAPGMPDPSVHTSHISQFVAELNRAMPELSLMQASVRSVWSGLLPDKDGTGRKLRSRDYFWEHGRTGGPRGLYTVQGTKLTTARALSEAVANRIWPERVPVVEFGFDPVG